MVNPSLKFRSQFELADYLAREASGIRARARQASPTSKRIMDSEAAAYERAVSLIRNLETTVDGRAPTKAELEAHGNKVLDDVWADLTGGAA